MSDRLDDRIRQIFVEADSAAPEPPPRPIVSTSQPRRTTAWMLPVTGLVVAILVVGVVSVLLGGGIGDGGEATGTTSAAAETTDAQDASATTVEAAETTAAPDTTAAAETTEATSDDPIAVLGEACVGLLDAVSVELTSTPTDPDGYRFAATYLEPFLVDFVEVIDRLAAQTGEPALTSALAEAETALDITNTMIQEADDGELTGLYRDLKTQLGVVGRALAEYGASDCADLGEALP